MDQLSLSLDTEKLLNPVHKLIHDHMDMMAAAYCQHTHLLPHEAVMRIQYTVDGQIVWFEPKKK